MALHWICLTIDTDPDELNTQSPDRSTLSWKGLEFAIERLHDELPDIPLTWYVRADGQLERAYGTALYLLEKHARFWQQAAAQGDELGWHPHLYTMEAGEAVTITDSAQAVEELIRLHPLVASAALDMPSFRMGEGWHTVETLNTVEQLGYRIDSSAIPGRDDSASGHPRRWKNTPNHPYYPAQNDISQPGEPRPLLEVPMNTWRFQASYDKQPKLRYMNPAIHPALWQQALYSGMFAPRDLHIWNLIFHPAEAMPNQPEDLLYARSPQVVRENLSRLTQFITAHGDSWRCGTVSAAAAAWRKQNI